MTEARPENGAATEHEHDPGSGTDRLVSLDKQARAYLTAHPVVALACAVGIGFFVGRLLSGRGTK